MEYIACNLCGSKNFKVLYKTERTDFGVDEYAPTGNVHANFGQIVKCAGCGLVYINPRERSEDIVNKYRDVVDPTCVDEEKGRVFTFERSLGEIEKFKKGGRILDIGCNIGTFVDVAKRKGWDAYGIEPNNWAAEYARKRGLNVFRGSLAESNFSESFFDAVTMWDVLEHFTDPSQELRRTSDLLKTGGMLFLTTMDIESLFARVMGKRYPWLMQMHLYYFSLETIKKMMAKNGLEVFRVSTHKRIIRLSYLVSRIRSYSMPLYNFLNSAVNLFRAGSLLVTVDMGDLVTVRARKV